MEFHSSLLCSKESAVEHARPVSIQGTQSHLKFNIYLNNIACQLGGFDPKPVYVEFFYEQSDTGRCLSSDFFGFSLYHSTNAPY